MARTTLWRRWWDTLAGWWRRTSIPSARTPETSTPATPALTVPLAPLAPLTRVVLTEAVSRVLFAEFAAHRGSARGEEETGWVLLGVREQEEAIALATLPAGAGREAGEAHVRFHSGSQALASRIVRQEDRRLGLIGVVHTHPGRLRRPSGGDYRGDILWVEQLRGREGVFGIGTAEDFPPAAHQQCRDGLLFGWYALAAGERDYRPLPVVTRPGPDLAEPLRPVWPWIEAHAARLDRLARQQARIEFAVVDGTAGPALRVTVPLAEPSQAVQILLDHGPVRYFVQRAGQWLSADLNEPRVDRGVYRILAELAGAD